MSFLQTSLIYIFENMYTKCYTLKASKLQNYIILCKAGGKNPLQLDLYVSKAFC